MDITWELKKLRNMKVNIIPSVAGSLGTVHKKLEKKFAKLKISGRIESIQTKELLKPVKILWRVLEIYGDLSFKH